MFDRKQLTRNPARVFIEPANVLENAELSVEDKISVLESWRLDLLELQRANDENMARTDGGSDDSGERLREVNESLALLRRNLTV
jgi:hypothetical protein